MRRKATKSELIFRKFLVNNKVYHKFQKGFLKPFHRIVDFYIPYVMFIIEIDGSIHDLSVDKDIYKDYCWRAKRGIQTIRIKNEEILSGSFERREDIVKLLSIAPTKSRRESRKSN